MVNVISRDFKNNAEAGWREQFGKPTPILSQGVLADRQCRDVRLWVRPFAWQVVCVQGGQ
jgi:hypothetical protein